MNKQNLILKIAEKLGVSRSQKELAFKIFINRVNEILDFGEALKIPDLGVFQLKKKKQAKSNKDTGDELNQIIFSPDYQNSSNEKLSLFLTIEVGEKNKFNKELNYDSFSLSVGKPMIPISNESYSDADGKITELYIQKSIQERITELLASSEKFEDFDLWDDYLSRQAKKETDTEQNKISQDTLKEDESNAISNSHIFDIDEDKPTSFYNEKDEMGKIILDEKKVVIDEFIEEQHQVAFEEPETDKLTGIDEINIPESELTDEKYVEISENGEEEISFEENNKQPANFDVKTEESNSEQNLDEGKEENSEEDPQTNVGNVNITGAAEHFEFELSNDDENHFYNNKNEKFEAQSQKANFTFWITLSLFILLTISGVYYFFFDNNNQETTQYSNRETATIQQSGMSNGLNRSNKLSGKNIVEQNSVKNSTEINTNNKSVSENSDNSVEKIIPVAGSNINKNSVNEEVEVEDLIFFDGKDYALQVSSWQNLDKAKRIAEKFSQKGYSTEVKSAEITGKGIWHRVRLTNIKSLDEAKKIKKIVLGK